MKTKIRDIFKYIFIMVCLLVVFLIKNNYDLKNKTQVVSEGSTESDQAILFENKQKCISYKNDIEKKMTETAWDEYVLEEIFYSSNKNSCLFSVIAHKESSTYLGESYLAYMIFDHLTDSLVFYRDSTLTNGDDIKNIYKNAVEYLKGNESLKYDKSKWNLD